MTIFSKNLGGHGPFGPHGYAYAVLCFRLFAMIPTFTCLYSSK